jgi:hypothetical protein
VQTGQRIVLASRPASDPRATDLRLEEFALPAPDPGEVLLKTKWLSLDPYMRGRMIDGPSYAKPVALGAVMIGGTVSEVVTSKADGFAHRIAFRNCMGLPARLAELDASHCFLRIEGFCPTNENDIPRRTVWWDKSLGVADHYRDEIIKQLAQSRAVIAIWSLNSVRSDWVRAEAGRAKVDGKLIPVKTAELTYADIPLPFGEMHTENVASTDLIRAAVVAQLAKPSVPLSPFWQITSTFKYQVLTWVGIVGTSITLFANLNGVLVWRTGQGN